MAFEFHVSRDARDRYEFDQSLFQTSGNVVLPNFPAARAFAKAMNDRRDAERYPDRVVYASQLNAMGLIDEILHHVVELYRRQVNPRVMAEALDSLGARLGPDELNAALRTFAEHFPPIAVYRGERPLDTYLAESTDGRSNREIALEELLMLWLSNANPAFGPFDELFDDATLAERTRYEELIAGLQAFFATQPGFGADNQSLIALLRAPALAVPDSLAGQLRFMRERWGLLVTRFMDRLVISLDVLKEEELALWRRMHPTAGDGGGMAPGLGLGGAENEYERFSEDRDWMPKVVLLAKTSYVWLDQLSKKYERHIRHLSDIPDEELDELGRRGFTGLWLIGVWERSRASQKIKQWRGNPDAAASAYSLMDYTIADDLGGEAAFENLRDRARARGIRLSSDMVPNHMGIDSRWVAEHPDWFLGLPDSPYPGYSFSGGNLSDDPRMTVQIEDHYWNASDAAVVFKRTDNGSGEARYIYHGNDGTSMPWNDTAQLDYLKPEVREAVIQTILHVARKFPIIRFDAAMTLARRHIERLWFPEPGQGGAIPSRAEHAIPRSEFEARMPQEFWREVVDRVAAEVPDTLLLAEAFWLMEGYFVRTLGMHRVYNSAFMNMLRDEDNAGYRRVMKDTMEFDPEILKRFVNFMSNPDERTAVDQFGKGDKYFGVATVMATMPGLPMIGHGQVEGFEEKYGMEYRRAYRDEQPDQWLLERHQREIFPLFHRRWQFAEVRDFLLYDVFDPAGWVNEDVFAFSNRRGDERSLVVYHNRYASASGWIHRSSAYSVSDGMGGRRLEQRTLGEGLGLRNEPGWYTTFRDHRAGLEYIRSNLELCSQGLFVNLHAYQTQVLLDFREVPDGPSGQLRRLTERLGGAGVPSIAGALRELQLAPLHTAIRGLATDGALRRLTEIGVGRATDVCGSLGFAESVDLGLHGPKERERGGAGAATGGGAAADGGTAPASEPAGQPASGESAFPTGGAPEETELPVGAITDATLREDAYDDLLDHVDGDVTRILHALAEVTGVDGNVSLVADRHRHRLQAALRLPDLLASGGDEMRAPAERLCAGLTDRWAWVALAGHLASNAMVALLTPETPGTHHEARAAEDAGEDRPTEAMERPASAALDELQLGPVLANVFRDLGLDEGGAWRLVSLIRLLRRLPGPRSVANLPPKERARALVRALLADPDIRPYIRVNVWEGVSWFNRESYEQLVWWMLLLDALEAAIEPETPISEIAQRLAEAARLADALQRAGEASGYQVDRLEAAAAEA